MTTSTAEALWQDVASFTAPHVVKRYADKNHLELEVAERHFKETLRFLYLCGVADFGCVPSLAIDECWHNFILFTRDYAKFCRDHFARFIHHAPQAHGNEANFERTLQLVKQLFRDEADMSIWKPESANCCQIACTKGCTECQAPSVT